MNSLKIIIFLFLSMMTNPTDSEKKLVLDQNNDKAHNIIDNYLKAIGGLEKIKSIKNIKKSVKLVKSNLALTRLGMNGVEYLESMTYLKRGTKNIISSSQMKYYDSNKRIIMTNKMFFDGDNLHGRRQFTGKSIQKINLSPIELKAKINTEIFPLEDYKNDNIYRNIEYLGIDTIDQIEHYKIKLKVWNGSKNEWVSQHLYFNKDTYLLKKIRQWNASGTLFYNTIYNNYKDFDGILMPTEMFNNLNNANVNLDYQFNLKNIASDIFTIDFN